MLVLRIMAFPRINELSREPEVTRLERPQFSDLSTKTIPLEYKDIRTLLGFSEVKLAISNCVGGDVRAVEAFLVRANGTDDYTIFLHVEDDKGNTALHFAAMETTHDMVALLLSHGSDVNAQNHEGRTPLMEAALWGRCENVRILLEHKADKSLRDKSGKLAIDLAQSSSENEEERFRRVEDFKEVAFEARHKRQQIIRMLETPLNQDQLFGFRASDNQGPHEDELVASLDRGDPFPLVKATSQDIGDDNEIVVGGRSLRQLVAEIAQLVGHQQCSASLASHASKQLIAYFIDKHAFLPSDVVDDSELDDRLMWRYADGDEEDENEERRIDLAQLKRGQPPVCLRRATIRSSIAACPDCKEFCSLVSSHFGLQLDLQQPQEDWFIPLEEIKRVEEKETKIGSGSFGRVELGIWQQIEVVVKRVDIDGQGGGDKRKLRRNMFWDEVRVWQRARHTNVVTFFGAYQDCSSWFIVSEYASGRTLTDYLSKNGRTLVWRKLHEVALGLNYLHNLGIVHSDIKSNNILVGKNGDAMLCDFGLSFEVSESRPKVPWSAIRYRPPEYVVENGIGPSFAGDVYSLGMCIIEAVTGEPPWQSNDDTKVKKLLRTKERLLRPLGMSDPEWELVESMCAFEPSARKPLKEVIQRLNDLAGTEEKELGSLAPISTPGESSTSTDQDSFCIGLSV